MAFVLHCRVKIHSSARAAFELWAQAHRAEYAALARELQRTRGRPEGSVPLQGSWIWTRRETFVSYVVRDEPWKRWGIALPFIGERVVIIRYIYAAA